MPPNPEPIVRCTVGHIVLLKPPLRRIDLDVSIYNTTQSDLTFMVPAVLNPTAADCGSSIFGVNTYKSPQFTLTFRQLCGHSSFWIFGLAAGASFGLRHLPIQFWPDEHSETFILETIHCTRVIVGSDLLSDSLALEPVEGAVPPADFSDFAMVSSILTPNCAEAPLTIVDGKACIFRFNSEVLPK